MAEHDDQSTLTQLMRVIQDRRTSTPNESYTARLLSQGLSKIAEKIIEEAGEVVEAAREEGQEGRRHLVAEAADLIYHLLVMLAARDTDWSEVESELARRFGISGLVEKASRSQPPQGTDE